ncbi:energy transducer TonB [Alginatibacterium sediminis]|uniref:Energy transducer TonB n=1 Tax=Alginatibacterium sediminis TaxID=2164068 RepID=A0A420ELE1_9ALTE|nr:energy transducer TonB [Alginatibacterium sediminis]RKF21460.1 energy transducer TonB [Alginatibacterium sediminis]
MFTWIQSIAIVPEILELDVIMLRLVLALLLSLLLHLSYQPISAKQAPLKVSMAGQNASQMSLKLVAAPHQKEALASTDEENALLSDPLEMKSDPEILEEESETLTKDSVEPEPKPIVEVKKAEPMIAVAETKKRESSAKKPVPKKSTKAPKPSKEPAMPKPARPELVPEKVIDVAKTKPTHESKTELPSKSQQQVSSAPKLGLDQSAQLNTKPQFARPPQAPDYPRKARKRGQEGVVTIEVSLSRAGHQQQIKIIASSGYKDLDAAALKAVRNWQFKPMQNQGKAVASRVRIPVRFDLG